MDLVQAGFCRGYARQESLISFMRHQRRNTTTPHPSLETPALFRKTVKLAYYRLPLIGRTWRLAISLLRQADYESTELAIRKHIGVSRYQWALSFPVPLMSSVTHRDELPRPLIREGITAYRSASPPQDRHRGPSCWRRDRVSIDRKSSS